MSMRAAVLSLLILTGCFDLPGAETPTTEIVLSDEEFNGHWRELERRWPAWFTCQGLPTPDLPNREAIKLWVLFQEVPHAYITSCTYGNRLIRIGDDKWDSGCVPHEIGHAVCDYIGDPAGCAGFEHTKC